MSNFYNLIITDIKISLRKKNENIISLLFFLFSILILPLIFDGEQIIIKKFLNDGKSLKIIHYIKISWRIFRLDFMSEGNLLKGGRIEFNVFDISAWSAVTL